MGETLPTPVTIIGSGTVITPPPEMTEIPDITDIPDIDLTAITDLLEKIHNELCNTEYLLSLILGVICFTMGILLVCFFVKFIKNSLFRSL